MEREAAENSQPRKEQLQSSDSSSEEQQPTPDSASVDRQEIRADAREQSREASSDMLREAAFITARSFQSSQEAMCVALEVLGRFLDSQTLFVARFGVNEFGNTDETCAGGPGEETLKIMQARNKGVSIPATGAEGALDRTYCHTILRTQQPLIVEDVRHYPFFQQLGTTKEYNIGSYIGVPLIYSDGRVYGTLCSQDPRPRPLSDEPEKLELMQIIARFLISHIEREELTAQLCAAEKAQAELARKERQARREADLRIRELEAVFEAMGDGVLVSDLNGRLHMNTAASHLLSHMLACTDLDDLLEKQRQRPMAWDEYGHALAPEQLPIVRVLCGEHLIGEKVVNIQRENAQGEKRYLSVSGMPIYDQENQVSGCVLVFRDVTERYLLERQTHETLDALLTLAESLAWLPENAPEFFSTASSSQESHTRCAGKQLTQLISTILQCQDVGIISAESETAQWQLLTSGNCVQEQHPSWWQEAMQISRFTSPQMPHVSQQCNNEVVIHALAQQEHEDEKGTPVLVEVPMFLGDRLLGVLALVYRQQGFTFTPAKSVLAQAVAKLTGLVIERERLLREQAETRAHALALQETNRRFNEFLSIASHELKGPLTSIKGNIQFAQRKLRALSSQRAQEIEAFSSILERVQHYLDRSESQIGVQDRLVSDLLDVSRIRAGKLELDMQPCDLGQIVRETVDDQRLITQDRIINLELPAQKMFICGDADRLGQVLNNYLTNALKYSSANEPVSVDVAVDGSLAQVTVSDQGPGLTPEEQAHVWERFYRAKDVHVLSGHGIGLGLGLHICKTIVEQHGGCVGLESTPGKGSHFWFTLPLRSDLPC